MADNLKLLLVDHHPMVLGMLQHALSSLTQVTRASDAADAQLKAVDDAPDLPVCDCRLPAMDGRQLIEKLKSRDCFRVGRRHSLSPVSRKKDEEEDVLLDG